MPTCAALRGQYGLHARLCRVVVACSKSDNCATTRIFMAHMVVQNPAIHQAADTVAAVKRILDPA